MQEVWSQGRFDEAIAAFGSGHPDAEQYKSLTTVILDHPKARVLAKMDPFSTDYRAGVLDLYATLRAREGDNGYVAERDEASESGGRVPADPWTGLVPWSFGDPSLTAEFLLAWGQILRLLGVGRGQSVLEYGPGSGQILLMLARMGVRAHGVDIDQTALDGIRVQAEVLGLPIALERAPFGEGFEGERFDAILFFEAFHHAFDFPALLQRLQARLKPGGRLVLCGEPIVDEPIPAIPFPWGPRLDALSVFCMRRWGWMELGFTRPFLVEAARRAGWTTISHPFLGCSRAGAFVLEVAQAGERRAPVVSDTPIGSLMAVVEQQERELAAIRRSTSWRLTVPLRAAGRLKKRLSGGRRPAS